MLHELHAQGVSISAIARRGVVLQGLYPRYLPGSRGTVYLACLTGLAPSTCLSLPEAGVRKRRENMNKGKL